ncbi:MAG TPA: hypothetical protein VG818_02915 [Gemmatimonadaceae bacterium]|nr:hypothetical protein [Gemmatimonadaceae bacterium]
MSSPLIAHVALGVRDSTELILSTVRADMGAPSDMNSLFVQRESRGWGNATKVIAGSALGPVHHPMVDAAAGDVSLVWSSPTRAGGHVHAVVRALLNAPAESLGLVEHAALVDTAGVPGNFRNATGSRAKPFWVGEDRPAGSSGELRVFETDRDSLRAFFSLPSPYLGPIQAIEMQGTIVVVGPVANFRGTGPAVVSVRLWIRADCAGE